MRGLRKRRAPISGLERPSRASPAIWRSCGGQLVARLDACACAPSRPWRAARGGRARRTPPGRIASNIVVGGAQLLARIHAPALAAQPLAVEQVRAGELRRAAGSGPGGRSPRGSAASAASPSLISARTRASMPSDQSLRVTRVRSMSHSSSAARAARRRRSGPPPRRARARRTARTRDDPRSKADRAASRASAWRPRPLCSTALA